MVEGGLDKDVFFKWLDSYQSQLVVISSQIHWTSIVENAIEKGELEGAVAQIESQFWCEYFLPF